MNQKVTIFKNVTSIDTPYYPSLDNIIDRIKNGKSKELIDNIRSTEDADTKQELKKRLPAICFSGIFSKRSDKSIEEHSGIICLDFDKFKSKEALKECKKDLSDDPYVLSAFISPSGDGIKVLVKIPKESTNHKLYFDALANYFDLEEFDRSCSNISRVCYESYDKNIYINYDSEVWDEKAEEDVVEAVTVVESNTSGFTIEVDDVSEKIKGLHKWWINKTGGLIKGDRNNRLFILCAAFNEFGIPMHEADAFVTPMEEKGFSKREIRIVLNSAYSNTSAFGTKVFEDKKKVSNYANLIKSGETKSEVKDKLINEEGISPDIADKIVKTIETKASEISQVFWTKNDKGRVDISPYNFSEYLSDNGFYMYRPDGANNYIFTQRRSNLIYNTDEDQIKKYVMDGYLRGLEDKSIYDFFAKKTSIFKYDFLSLMQSIDIEDVMDEYDKAHLYYKNCVVVITKDAVETYTYEDFNHWVWADQIINRDFIMSEDANCDYKNFIVDLSDSDNDRQLSIESTIGYLLHGYKDKRKSPAVILNDEVISDNPEGGTGKGLFVQGISNIKNTAIIDGKDFKSKERFSYQTVKPDTQVASFDDVPHNFNFENLFSIITEGMTLEYKNQTAIKIPFEKSPKIVITTNYAIPGKGNSHDRRRWELEFSQFYNKKMTPFERFGRRLFDDWDDAEWIRFDNYMINCLQYFLKNGLVESKFKNLAQRKFHSETCMEFADWAEDKENEHTRLDGSKVLLNDMYTSFVSDNPDYFRMKRKTFYKYVDIFGEYKYGARPNRSRINLGVVVTFVDGRSKEKQSKINI